MHFIVFLAPPDEEVISPAELAVLDALMNGGQALSLKVLYFSYYLLNEFNNNMLDRRANAFDFC